MSEGYATRCRFVSVEKDRIDLSGGNWIEVKKRLGVGEQKLVEGAGLKRVRDDKTMTYQVELDHDAYSFTRAEVYILDWSYKNAEDKPVQFSSSALRALDVDTFEEIDTALMAHVEKQEQEKKARAGASAQPGT